ncbi:MAG: 2,3-bisphosphoglycerate-independent phosphoglycerate mutase, partial [Candidatus Buchananbacteria bacterium]|nr:2,3-bisphosphoglycerate-independent phosphoglycerate mutase [Candidatus Buchananbacteria bacterium]
PNMDLFYKKYPNTELTAHGEKVGLPKGQDGNSEAGHMNIGAGRIAKQDSVLILDKIKNNTFFKNTALIEAVNHAKKNKSNLHLMGLLADDQSAHAHPEHLYALLDFLKKQKFHRVYLHLFTDGRDSSPHAAARLISKLINNFENNEIISTIIGRFYAMDRIKAWHRTELAYNAMVLGEGIVSDNPYKAITEAYNRGETDEFISPTVILNPKKKPAFIDHNDAVIFFNLRSDRARQLTKPFVQKDFEKKNGKAFKRKKVLKNLKFVALTEFGPDLNSILTAFPSVDFENTLPFMLDNYKQLYISEREKYAHVTYFLNGGHSKPVNGEEWQVIPSSGKGNYENDPAMSTQELTDIIIKDLKKEKFDFITVNFPNPDMLGHTGNFEATKKGVETVDKNVGRLYELIKKIGGTMVITADHGNAEELKNPQTGEMDTEHSDSPVPFIIVNEQFKNKDLKLRKKGILGDIAPTILHLLNIKKPKEMTGKSLIKSKLY